ncbi:MAG TPA: hypothetical protein VIJ11_09000 [Galbitalea sp.]
MFQDDAIAGSWSSLAARLDCGRTITRWGDLEPALVSVRTASQLPELLARGTSRSVCDEILGALVRLAAADGHDDQDDQDATLVVLHLLSDGALAIARNLDDLSGDILPLVVGELTLQIRSFPWRRRTRAIAANLLLDTKAALWRELRPQRTPTYRRGRDVLVNPLDRQLVARLLDDVVAGPGDSGELDLLDVCVWAERTGVAPAADLALLLDVTDARQHGGDAQRRVAARWQIDERTLRRRRNRALGALAAASDAYLAACA